MTYLYYYYIIFVLYDYFEFFVSLNFHIVLSPHITRLLFSPSLCPTPSLQKWNLILMVAAIQIPTTSGSY